MADVLDELQRPPDTGYGSIEKRWDPEPVTAAPAIPLPREQRLNRIKAEDLAERGIPTYREASSGRVSAITDESGAALSGYDSRHGVAYDKQGAPREIVYGETGPPTLEDPFRNLPPVVDLKTGAISRKGKGLYRYEGQDPAITTKLAQKAKDQELAKQATLLGRKLTLDEHDLHAGTVEHKSLTEQLQNTVPTLLDPKMAGADRETIVGAIEKHFSAEYEAPEAKKTAWFSDDLTPEAATKRADIDTRKAKALQMADKLFGLKDKLSGLTDTVSKTRDMERIRVETELAHSLGQPGPMDEAQPGAQPKTGAGGQLYPDEADWPRMLGGEKAAEALHEEVRKGNIPPTVAPAALAATHDIEDAKKKAAELEKTDPTTAEKYKNFAATMLHGLSSGIGDILRSPMGRGELPGGAAHPLNWGIMSINALKKQVLGVDDAEWAGKKLPELTAKLVDDRLKDTFAAKAGNFIGGMTPYVATAIATRGTSVATPLMMSMFYNSGYQHTLEDAQARGVDPVKAELAATGVGAVNAILALPLKTVGKAAEAVFGSTAPKVIEKAITNAFENGGPAGLRSLLEKLATQIKAGGAGSETIRKEAVAGIEKVLGITFKTAAERTAIVAKEAAQGAAIGAGVKTSENLIKKTYNPDQGTFEGVTETALGFGALSAVSSGFKQVVDARNAKRALDLITSKGGGKPPPASGGQPALPAGKPPKGPAPTAPEPRSTSKPVSAPKVAQVAPVEPTSKIDIVPGPTTIVAAEKAFVEKGGHVDRLDAQTKLTALQKQYPEPAARIAAINEHLGGTVDVAAHEAATSPTNDLPEPSGAQKEAGNYPKGHVSVSGLDVSIENPAGTKRQASFAPLTSHYGYIKGTVGADKDHVDIFVKQGTPKDWSGPVFVVNQHNKAGGFDEHKAVIGVSTLADAKAEYNANYQGGWTGGKSVVQFENATEFKEWATSGAKGKPAVDPRLPSALGAAAAELHVSFNGAQAGSAEGRLLFSDTSTNRPTTFAVRADASPEELQAKVEEVRGKAAGESVTLKDLTERRRALLKQKDTSANRAERARLTEQITGELKKKREAKNEPKTASVEKPAEAKPTEPIHEEVAGAVERSRPEARIQTAEQAKGGVEKSKTTHAKEISALEAEHKEGTIGRGGFKIEPDGSAIVVDHDAIAEGARAVEESGGDGQAWIEAAHKEELIHLRDLIVSGPKFDQIHQKIWNGIPAKAQTALKALYPDTTNPIHLAAEYLRMVKQLREDGRITESHFADALAMKPYLEGKQTEALEQQLRSMAALTAPPAPAPKRTTIMEKAPPGGWRPEDKVPRKDSALEKRAAELAARTSALVNPAKSDMLVITTLLRAQTGKTLDQAETKIDKLEKATKPAEDAVGAALDTAFEGLFAAKPERIAKTVTKGESGKKYYAPIHAAAALDAVRAGEPAATLVDGFETNTGRFLTREQAHAEFGQANTDVSTFTSKRVAAIFAAKPVMTQRAIPADKLPAFMTAAQELVKQSIDTPQKLADVLEAKFSGKARPFSQALWDAIGMVNPALRGTHDWPKLYAPPEDKKKPEAAASLTSDPESPTIAPSESAVSERSDLDAGARPSGGTVAGPSVATAERRPGEISVAPGLGDVEGAGGGEQVEPAVRSSVGERAADVPGTEPGVRPGESEAARAVGSGETARVPEPGAGSSREQFAHSNHVIAAGDEIAPSGDITKIRANLAAIKLVKKLQAEDRFAHPEEKQVLARYVGWGGLPQVFDQNKAYDENWKKKYGTHATELKSLLTPDEFSAARASTLNAHYTSRPVISGIWDAVKAMGFKGGTVGEFGAGVGHFFGLMPQEFQTNTALQAIERDQVSGQILSKLYPQARVRIASLEDAKVAPNSVDLFVGNVPFAQTGPHDPNYPELNLHNYFLAREFDALKPGGLAAVISTSHTLDSSKAQREFLAGKAELLGAIRLPNDAFKANAGTEVNVDILFFRKPDSPRPAPEPFVGTVEIPTYDGKSTIPVNEYFGRHPEMILGRPSREGSMYGPDEPAIIPFPDKDLGELIQEAIAKLPKNIVGVSSEPDLEHAQRELSDSKDKPGSFVHKDGKLFIVTDVGTLAPAVELNPRFKAAELVKRAKNFISLRDSYKELLAHQINPEAGELTIKAAREKLNEVYDKYVKQHGAVNELKTRPFSSDPEFGLMSSLEDRSRIEREGKAAYEFKKADVFTKRTQYPYSEPTSAETVRDGLLASLAYRGSIRPDYVAELTGKTAELVERELVEENLAYQDPATGHWQTVDHYLSGNVRAKLAAARTAAEGDAKYQRNVEGLTGVQPKPIGISEINVRLGGAWIPEAIVSAFGKQLFNMPRFKAQYVKATDTWLLEEGYAYTPEATSTYAGGGMNGPELFKASLNLKNARVMDRVSDGKGGAKYVFNPTKTAAAQAAQDKIGTEFRKYVNADSVAAEQLEKAYNDAFNGHVLAKYDGSHLTLPGSSTAVELRPIQKDAIWRIIQDGYAMLAHAVGAGKTYEMIGAAMEMRRLGLARKPMLVVKNPTLPQFAASFMKMYPSAKVLVGSKEDLSKDNRNTFMSRIASGDWDAVVVAQSSFDRLPSDPERERSFIMGQIDDLEDAIRDAKERNGKRDPSVKDMEKAKERHSSRLKEISDRPKDNTINFEQLGVDALFIDEAHDYKKPPFVTKLERVGGLNTQVSKRAFALLMKTRFIQEKNNGRNVILATGTPVTNTLGEAWHMLNLGAPHILEDYGVTTFDRFVSAFAVVLPSMELNAAGNWVIKPRLSKFVNGPELLTMIRSAWDVVTTEQLHEMFGELNIDVPKVAGGKVRPVAVPRTAPVAAYVEFLKKVYKAYQDSPNKRDISAVPIMAYMSGRVAALDPRLIDAGAEDDPGSKVNVAIREILRIHKETAPQKSTQLVFMENYRSMNTEKLREFAEGKGLNLDMGADYEEAEITTGFNLFDDIKTKLVAGGVPAEEIARIIDYDTETKKAQLFDAMNAGNIRIMLGGTQKMGVGVNVQQKLKALHHLDAPWMPSDLEQREGRAIRQGNENEEVELISYGMINTLDAGLYTKIAAKAKFLRQVLSGRFSGREFDDPTGPLIVSAEEQQALLSGNPLVLKKVEVDNKVRQLGLELEGYDTGKTQIRYRLRNEEAYVKDLERELMALRPTLETLNAIDGETWAVKIGPQELTDRKQIIAAIDRIVEKQKPTKEVGHYDAPTIEKEGNLIVAFTANGVDVAIHAGLYRNLGDPGGPGDPRYSTTMKVSGAIVYNGEAKSGVGILGALTDLPVEVKDKITRREGRIATAQSDVAKFTKLLEQPFDKAEELAAAQAEQKAINAELLGEKKDGKTAADELFEIGYSAVPLLTRIDNSIDELREKLRASDEAVIADDELSTRDENLSKARLSTMEKRRATVEAKRYDSVLAGAQAPYGYTLSKSGGLYAARPVRAVAAIYTDDIEPVARGIGLTVKESLVALQHLVSPTTGVAMDAHDRVMGMLGERNQKAYETDRVLEAWSKAVDEMPRRDQIEFVDRMKRGDRQRTPELQQLANTMRIIDTESWQAARDAYAALGFGDKEIPLKWKDNHYRVLWKKIPGSTDDEKAAWIGRSRRGLRGSMGQHKQATLEDMSAGIAEGGIPYSYNFVHMFKLAQVDLWKLTSTLRVWKWGKDNGFVEFTKGTHPDLPDGMTWLDDAIANIYFPAESGEGLVIGGRYAVEEGFGRLLNNYLSRDFIREFRLGRGLMWLKNATTAIELSISPFHAVFETLEIVGSDVGLGLTKLVNRGLLRGDLSAAASGVMDIVKAPISPVTTFTLGNEIRKAAGDPSTYFKTAAGKKMLKSYPRAREMIDDLFAGGWKPNELEQDWKNQSVRAFVEAVADIKAGTSDNYIGAGLRAFPAANEMIMKPLFDVYIPSLKVAQFFKEYSSAMEENERKLKGGVLTRQALARQVWRFVEDRFGEMNFDSLFWNANFKTAMQLMFRSVTWKLGSLEAFYGAFAGQGKEFIDAFKERRAPELHRNMAWLFGMLLLTATLGALLMKGLTGKWPSELKDYVFPQIDPKDPKVRASLPTYFKDMVHLIHSPTSYVTASMSGWIGRVADLLRNKDYYGVQIHDNDDPVLKQALDMGKYAAETLLPFSVRGYKNLSALDVGALRKALALLAVNPAPRHISQTPADKAVEQYWQGRQTEEGISPAQMETKRAKSQLVSQIRHGHAPDMAAALASGAIKRQDVNAIYQRAQIGSLASGVKYMPLPEAEKIYKLANAKERVELAPIMATKRRNALEKATGGSSGRRAPVFQGF